MSGNAYSRSGGSSGQGLDTVGTYLQIDLLRMLSWLRAGLKWILLCVLLGALLGAAYAMLATRRYTVTTDILMNPSGLQVVSDDLYSPSEQRESILLSVESKRQTLLSRSVLLRVVEDLDLQNDAEFVPPSSPLSLQYWIGGGGQGPSPTTVALNSLDSRLTARRDEASFVVTMAVWTEDPQKSIRISNAIMDAFRQELVASDKEGARRSVEGLNARLEELRRDVNAAAEAVETFRREHGLQATQGELMSARSMTQVNQQLVEARQRLIAAQSRYDALSSPSAADVAATVSNTISALRVQSAALQSNYAALSLSLGSRHPRLAQMSHQLRALEEQIAAETKRVVASARKDLDQARDVVAALERQAANAGTEVFADNDAEIRLRALTREAAAKTAVYEAFLARANTIGERQQLDTTNIRVISAPVLPRARSWPPSTSQASVFGGMAGMILGIIGVLGAGITREVSRGGDTAPALPPQRDPAPRQPPRDDRDRFAERDMEPIPGNRRGSLLSLANRS